MAQQEELFPSENEYTSHIIALRNTCAITSPTEAAACVVIWVRTFYGQKAAEVQEQEFKKGGLL